MRAFDTATMRKAFSGAGTDTRAWLSYGIVDEVGRDEQAVTFDDDFGLMVTVTLVPSRTTVHCRAMPQSAGDMETQYSPFISGDEVLVAMPQGEEDSGCIILGRLNNGIDKWPATIAGHDIKSNLFEAERGIVPKVIERTAGHIINHSPAGAWYGYVPNGDWCSSTKTSQIFQNEKASGLVNKDGDCGIQMDHSSKLAFAFSGSSRFDVGGSGASLGLPSAGIVCGSAPNGSTAPSATGGVVTDELLASLLASLNSFILTLNTSIVAGFTAITPTPIGAAAAAAYTGPMVQPLLDVAKALASAIPYASKTVKSTP